MVEKLNNLIAQVEQEKGKIFLFMLWKNLPDDNTWSVIISANWIEQISQNIALQYWISKIRSSLSKDELSKISRVSFLRSNDRMVNLITSAIRVTTTPVRFSKNQIKDFYIEDAIIFRAEKNTQKKVFSINNKNPIFNHNINPIFNHNINPIFNPNFSGYYLYDDKLRQSAYIVYANDEIILIFNLDNNLQMIGAKNSINGFTLFDTKQNWSGTMIPDQQNGFIFYSQSNQKIGFVK